MFPKSQNSPPSSSVCNSVVSPERPSPFLSANGPRRRPGRPPKNWPWGKVKDRPRPGPGRPRKIRPPEDEDDDDDDDRIGINKVTTTSPHLALDNEPDSTSACPLERHPAIPPPRSRGRPPRKKRGPKRRLIEEPVDGLPLLSHTARLSEPVSVRPPFFSESSEDEEDDDDDEDDDEDEDLRTQSPPVLTKPTLGLKCKVSFFVLAFKVC